MSAASGGGEDGLVEDEFDDEREEYFVSSEEEEMIESTWADADGDGTVLRPTSYGKRSEPTPDTGERRHRSFTESLKERANDAGLGEEFESIDLVSRHLRSVTECQQSIQERVARRLFVTGGVDNGGTASLAGQQASQAEWTTGGGGLGAGGSAATASVPPSYSDAQHVGACGAASSAVSSATGGAYACTRVPGWSASAWGRRVERFMNREAGPRVLQLELKSATRQRSVSAGAAVGNWSSGAVESQKFGFQSWYPGKDEYLVGLNGCDPNRPRPIVWRGSRYDSNHAIH